MLLQSFLKATCGSLAVTSIRTCRQMQWGAKSCNTGEERTVIHCTTPWGGWELARLFFCTGSCPAKLLVDIIVPYLVASSYWCDCQRTTWSFESSHFLLPVLRISLSLALSKASFPDLIGLVLGLIPSHFLMEEVIKKKKWSWDKMITWK